MVTPSDLRLGQHPKILKLSALTSAGLDLTESKFVDIPDSIARRFSLQKNDLLICRSNAYDYVGKCAVVEEDRPDILFPDIVICIRLRSDVLPNYTREVIETPLGRSHFQIISRRAVGGMWKISDEDIRNFPIPLPPLDVQLKIIQQTELVRSEIARERERAHQLATAIDREIEEIVLGTRPVPEFEELWKGTA
jgi:type I restriction enzyme, S subunit